MVITDSLEFAILRRLGVAFQRVPTAPELGLASTIPPTGGCSRQRFDDAMSPWHGKWPMRRIGDRQRDPSRGGRGCGGAEPRRRAGAGEIAGR